MKHPLYGQRTTGAYPYIRSALRLRVPLAWAAIGFALLGLTFGYGAVGGAATHPLTALCFVGLAVAILRTKRFEGTSSWRVVLLCGVVAICAARLMDAGLGATAGMASFVGFGPIAGFGGMFSVSSAITLGAFGLAALVRQGGGRWGGVFLVTGLACVFNTFVGMSYGGGFFSRDVSLFTHLAMVTSALAMLSVYVHRPFVRVAFLMGDIGAQTRLMGAAIVVLPWAFGLAMTLLFGGAGGSEAAMVSVVTCSLMVILLSSSTGHEGSVAARRRAEREIAMLSRVDPMTGALNPFGMNEALEGAWLEFRSSGGRFGMILMDLDYFRKLDETFGLDDGEGVLARVAATVQPQLRETDALGRWGRDEFLILLKIKDDSDVEIVAARLRRALADATQPLCAGLTMQPAAIEVSLGKSVMADRDRAPTDAIVRADASLFADKTVERVTVKERSGGRAKARHDAAA